MFRVEWHQAAMDELTNLWTKADSAVRKATTAASHQIDKRLQIDPANEGESRSGGRRIQFFPPLTIIFEVDEANRTVTVLHVRLYGRRKK